jgi:NIMA (never in mitosis gene a)-related kinase
MSPEIWRRRPYNKKSDIWSLGCLLYELTSLKHPFEARDERALADKVTRGVYNPIPSCYSADLTAVIKMMLVVDPSRRCNIDELLAHPIIQSRINDAGIKCGGPEAMESARARDNLVETIRVPRQLGQLQGKLPGAKWPAAQGERPSSARPREEVLAYGNEPASKQARKQAPSIDGSRANSENQPPPKSHRDPLAPAQDPSRAPSQIGSKMPFVSAYERRVLQEKQNRYGNRY